MNVYSCIVSCGVDEGKRKTLHNMHVSQPSTCFISTYVKKEEPFSIIMISEKDSPYRFIRK